MFFKKNIHKIMEKTFLFLIDEGFILEKYNNGPNLELYYVKENISINLYYYLGMKDSKSVYCFDVALLIDDTTINILSLDKIFGKDNILKLKKDIYGISNDKKVLVFAKFIKENLSLIL